MKTSDPVFAVDTPLGVLAARVSAQEIRGLRFIGDDEPRPANAGARLARELAAWFRDGREPLHYRPAPSGTAFQQQVWQATRAIPRGTAWTYTMLARQLGRPNAVRAVASALAANPVLLLIPCHRVIGRNGHLCGYAGGIPRKRALLALEGWRSASGRRLEAQ